MTALRSAGSIAHVACPLAAALVAGFAYRDLLALDFRPGLLALESWFTRPTGLPFPLALGGALYSLARRRDRWRALPPASDGRALAVAAFAASAAALAWSSLTGVVDLGVQSLAALGLATAATLKGRAGARLVLVPALFLLLALSPSPAAVNELFWLIQVHTARVAAAVVDGMGRPVLLETVALTTPGVSFLVIESCASLGVMVVLVSLALLLREGIARAGPRSWLLVAAAAPLAVALNLVRIVSIVLDPEINRASHLVQWAVLLSIGALSLLAGRRALARPGTPGGEAFWSGAPEVGVGSGATTDWRPLLVGLVLLAGLSCLPRPAQPPPASDDLVAIPLEHAGWRALEVDVDRRFLGWVRFREIVSRVYRREEDVVRLFVGIDDSRARTASPFSSKTLLPGFGWVAVEGAGAEASSETRRETAIVVRETSHWWVAQWRLGYHGMLGEALRHLFAVDASPFAPPRTRAVVRLHVPLSEVDPPSQAAAAHTLERFLADFADFLPLSEEATRDAAAAEVLDLPPPPTPLPDSDAGAR